MLKFLLMASFLFTLSCFGSCKDKPVVVAVIDTGFGYSGFGKEAKLCANGHKDFTNEKVYGANPEPLVSSVPIDTEGHGTNIVGIIESYAKPAHINYCILILKYYERAHSSNNGYNTIEAFREAKKAGAKYINYSSGGDEYSQTEKDVVEDLLNNGTVITVAAGNESKNLDLPGNNYYPAKYDSRIIVVGMLEKDGVQSKISNYGKKVVNRWEIGRSVTGYRVIQSGTSQASATAMGKILAQEKNKCDIGK